MGEGMFLNSPEYDEKDSKYILKECRSTCKIALKYMSNMVKYRWCWKTAESSPYNWRPPNDAGCRPLDAFLRCPAMSRKSGVRAPLSRGSHHELAHAVKKTRAAYAHWDLRRGECWRCFVPGFFLKGALDKVESLHGLWLVGQLSLLYTVYIYMHKLYIYIYIDR